MSQFSFETVVASILDEEKLKKASLFRSKQRLPVICWKSNDDVLLLRSRPKIKVLEIGGAGCNAIHNMAKSKLGGMEFIACNTDIQSLNYSGACEKIIDC
eukprot:gene7432-11755_t